MFGLWVCKTLTSWGTQSCKKTWKWLQVPTAGGGAGRPTLRNAQGSIDAQPDFRVLLGPIDDGVISPETEPIVRGQGSNVVTQEKEDAQKGDEKSYRLHVVPVHGELDLRPGREGILQNAPSSHAHPRSGTSTDPVVQPPNLCSCLRPPPP